MKSRRGVVVVAALAALVTSGCVTAAVAGGVVVVGIGAAVLASGCDEPVAVNVWDRGASHPICDATVIAEQDGSTTTFSPCYTAHLGTGTWIVTATRPGAAKATGIVTISKDRHCSEPIYHSLDLTLGSDATMPEPRMPLPPGTLPPPAPLPPTASPPAVSPPAATPGPTPAPSGAAPAPSATVPTAGFPEPAVQAPPTR